jgi:peroxiredoxin
MNPMKLSAIVLSTPFALLALAAIPARPALAFAPPAASYQPSASAANAQGGAPTPQGQKPPSAVDAARLAEAFHSVEQELQAALSDYQRGVNEATAKHLPREQWPRLPTPDFYPRFEELALQDQPDALRWCIGSVSVLALSFEETIARKEALYKRVVRAHPSSPFIRDIVKFLQAESAPAGIGVERAAPLLDTLVATSTLEDVRISALWTKALLYSKSPSPEHAPLLRKTYEALVAQFPASDEGKRAKGILYQLDHLQVGQVAPDFTTADVDGNAFKLSDFRGKVTVVSFFGFWCPPCRAMLPGERELALRLKDEPFAMVGIDTDEDKVRFKQLAAEQGVTWKVSWQGSRRGALPLEWGVQSYPTTYVLDAKGVIRYAYKEATPLATAVDALLAEMKAPKPAENKPSEKKPDDPKPH